MIATSDIHKTYVDGETEVRALRGVSLTVEPGEFLSIAGPSGSGKTTLLNIIGCIDTADSGTVVLDGVKMNGQSNKERAELRRRKLGFVFQSFNLIPVLTSYENVALVLSLLNLSKEETYRRTMALLAEVGLTGMEGRLPAKLSGGQQQRVAVARALVKEPLIVLADEPTANLDSETGEGLLRLMEEMNEKNGTTFVFSTHDEMVMRHAKRLVLVHDGTITEDKRQ